MMYSLYITLTRLAYNLHLDKFEELKMKVNLLDIKAYYIEKRSSDDEFYIIVLNSGREFRIKENLEYIDNKLNDYYGFKVVE